MYFPLSCRACSSLHRKTPLLHVHGLPLSLSKLEKRSQEFLHAALFRHRRSTWDSLSPSFHVPETNPATVSQRAIISPPPPAAKENGSFCHTAPSSFCSSGKTSALSMFMSSANACSPFQTGKKFADITIKSLMFLCTDTFTMASGWTRRGFREHTHQGSYSSWKV